MKAIRVQQFGDPEVLQIAEVPDLTPGPGQILVRIHAAGINPVETYKRSGKYPLLPDLPYTPGTDGAGTIAAIGSAVTARTTGIELSNNARALWLKATHAVELRNYGYAISLLQNILAEAPGFLEAQQQLRRLETIAQQGKESSLSDSSTIPPLGHEFKVGDRVYLAGSITGTYAEQALCEPAQVHPLPDSITFPQGAALGVPYTTAHLALFHRGQAQAGETVLIHGATGGVGLAAIQIAHAAGMRVFGTGGTDAGRAQVKREGADVVFDHHAENYPPQILEATGGRGVNVILEMLANINLGKDLPLLATGGRVVVIGSRGPVEINPRDLMFRNADIRGVFVFGTPPEVLAATHHALVEGLEKGALRPIIAREFPLAEAPQAHHAMGSTGVMGKIVLVM